jgi:hypothetical protein
MIRRNLCGCCRGCYIPAGESFCDDCAKLTEREREERSSMDGCDDGWGEAGGDPRET